MQTSLEGFHEIGGVIGMALGSAAEVVLERRRRLDPAGHVLPQGNAGSAGHRHHDRRQRRRQTFSNTKMLRHPR